MEAAACCDWREDEHVSPVAHERIAQGPSDLVRIALEKRFSVGTVAPRFHTVRYGGATPAGEAETQGSADPLKNPPSDDRRPRRRLATAREPRALAGGVRSTRPAVHRLHPRA